MMKARSRLLCGVVAVSVFAIGSQARADPAPAASPAPATGDGTNPNAVQDIIVTARKRSENVQKIPVAITTKSAEQLAQQRIVQVNDLGKVVPSLQIKSRGIGSTAWIFMRGQGSSDTVIGVSQPIGLYEDTVNIAHTSGSNSGFFDIARVEVLKGPQGTLYGRNTTGGAINVITRSADFEGVHGYVDAEVGNFHDTKISFALNAPIISDILAVRLAYQRWDKDGYMRSAVSGQNFGDAHKDNMVRASIKFSPVSNFTADLKVSHSSVHSNGLAIANVSIGGAGDVAGALAANAASANNAFYSAALWANYATYAPLLAYGMSHSAAGDPNQATALADLRTVINAGAATLAPCIGGSIYINCSSSQQRQDVKTWHGSLDMKWDISDSINVRSITGLHYYRDFESNDLGGVQPQLLLSGAGPQGAIAIAPTIGSYVMPGKDPADQQSTQWSQEVDLSGKLFDDRISWLAGAYLSRDRGKGGQRGSALSQYTAFSSIAFAPLFDPLATTKANPQNNGTDLVDFSSDTWGLYTQDDFHITSKLSATVGVRYTQEKLGQLLASYNYYNTPNTTYASAASFDNGAGGAGTYVGPLNYVCSGTRSIPGATQGLVTTTFAPPNPNDPTSCAQAQDARGIDNAFSKAKFSAFTYLASLNYQLNDDVLVYAKYARGFRGGAFGKSAGFPAKPETTDDYEIGVKSELFDRRLRLNVAVYDTEYRNKQVTTLACLSGTAPPCGTGGFTTTIRNAASARIRGVEVEAEARPVARLTLTGEVSYTDAYYVKWLGAVTVDGTLLSAVQPANVQGSAAGIPLSITPDWQGRATARYMVPVDPGAVAFEVDYTYRGSMPITPLTDQALVPNSIERWENRAVGIVDARVEFELPRSGLKLSVWSTNLAGVKYGVEGISAGYTGSIGHLLVDAPRTFGVTIRKTFGAG